MALYTVGRDKPDARATIDTPPRPNARASAATASRRCRSLRCSSSAANFSASTTSTSDTNRSQVRNTYVKVISFRVLSYCPDVLSRDSVEAMGARLVRVLDAMVRDPWQPVGQVETLSPTE